MASPKTALRISLPFKIILIALPALILLYTIIGFWVIPPVIKSVAPKKIAPVLKRQLVLEQVAFNPYSFRLRLAGVKIIDHDKKLLFSLDELLVRFKLSALIRHTLQFREISFKNPYIRVVLLADGKFNFDDLTSRKSTAAAPPPAKEQKKPLRIVVENLHLAGGRIEYADLSRALTFTTNLKQLDLKVKDFTVFAEQNSTFQISLSTEAGEQLNLSGRMNITPFYSQGALELKKIRLPKYRPYYDELVGFKLDEGILDLRCNYSLYPGKNIGISNLNIVLADLKMSHRQDNTAFLLLPRLELVNGGVNLTARRIAAAEINLDKLDLLIQRDANGALNLTRLASAPKTKAPAPVKQDAAITPKPSSPKAAKPWEVSLSKLNWREGRINFEDLSRPQPVRLSLAPFNLALQDINFPSGERPILVDLTSGYNQNGQIKIQGEAGLKPLTVALDLNLSHLDIRSAEPYWNDKLNVLVTDGNLNVSGKLSLSLDAAGKPQIVYLGQSSVANLFARDKKQTQPLVSWRSLFLENMEIGYNPLKVRIRRVALNDFYARLLINPDKSLNVLGLAQKSSARPSAPAPRQTAPVKSRPAAPLDFRIDSVTMQNGRINFTDASINPRFDIDMLKLGGRVSGLTSRERTTGEVLLLGSLENQSPLKISGRINPLAKDLFIDLKVDFQNIELSPFTPYSSKYLGYTVDKGKLNLELAYKIIKNQLDATHRIGFNQFTLGKSVDSPQAVKVPLKLAVALLKDRNGNIEINMPVTGDLKNPKFHIWETVRTFLLNLLTKIAAAPFTAIGSLVGGGEELSYIEFDYGAARLLPEQQEKLNKILTALAERPALNLEIKPYIDSVKDTEGLRRVKLQELLIAEKRKQKGAASEAEPAQLTPEETPKLLKAAYLAAPFPKPRDELGRVKALPPEEMEKLLYAHILINANDLRLLALERTRTVKEFLLADAKLAPERVFLLEPDPVNPEMEIKSGDPLNRVKFTLK